MIAVLLSVLAVSADPEPAPKGHPPTIVVAWAKDDSFLCAVPVPITRVEKRTYKVEKDGKVEIRVYDVMVQDHKTELRSYDLKQVTFATTGGKKLTPDDARKRLERRQLVVTSTVTGQAVDPAYLKVFDGDTLVVVLPEPKGPEKK